MIRSVPVCISYCTPRTYALTRYSIGHFADFIRGHVFDTGYPGKRKPVPPLLKSLLERAARLLNPDIIQQIAKKKSGDKLQPHEVVEYGNFIRNHFKPAAQDLISIYGKLDAWYSMAMAGKEYNLVDTGYSGY